MMASYRAVCRLALFLLACPTVARSDTSTTTIPVTDASLPGSPFLVSGSVQRREITLGNKLRSRTDYNVALRNISNRTVLAFSARLTVGGPSGGPESYDTNIECFFAVDVIKPGQEEVVTRTFPSESAQPYNPSYPLRTPRAEFRTLFAQFADGSIFGPEVLGREIMERRRITWKHLRDLLRIYEREGEAAFVAELMETMEPPQVNTFFENLRQTQRQQGTQATLARIRASLLLAEERQAAFKRGGN